jgi:hypothetical protein
MSDLVAIPNCMHTKIKACMHACHEWLQLSTVAVPLKQRHASWTPVTTKLLPTILVD